MDSSLANSLKPRIIVLSGAILVAALAGIFLFKHDGVPPPALHATFEDKTVLPQGEIRRPSDPTLGKSSELSVTLRVNLSALERAANGTIPTKQTINKEDGKGSPKPNTSIKGDIIRDTISIRRGGSTRLDLSFPIRFSGTIDAFISKISEIKAILEIRMDLSTTADWTLKNDPTPSLEITSIEASKFPDRLAKVIANYFAQRNLDNFNLSNIIPIHDIAQHFWKYSQQEIILMRKPWVQVGLQPVGATLFGPLISESDNQLILIPSVQLKTWLIGAPSPNPSAHDETELPPLQHAQHHSGASALSIPASFSLAALKNLVQPGAIPWLDGRLTFKSVQFRDADGMLYAKLSISAELPAAFRSENMESFDGILAIKCRPGCNPNLGELSIEEFDFTPESKSIAGKHLGEKISASFLAAIKDWISSGLSKWFSTGIQLQAASQVEAMMRTQLDALLKDIPGLREEARNIVPGIANLRVLPEMFDVKTGYLRLILKVTGEFSLEFK